MTSKNPGTHAAGARPSTIPALDTVRVIGVLAVIITHVGFHAGVYTNSGLWGHVISRMAVGVSVFFVLSGFLLSREWLVRAASHQPRPSLGRYYWKRWWRIMPAYLVVAAVCLLAFSENSGYSVWGWIKTLLLLDSYTSSPLPTGFTQTWSLATEVAFYLVLPLLMMMFVGRSIRPRRVLIGVATLGVVSLVWLVLMRDIGLDEAIPVGNWLPAYLSWFAAGIWLAAAHTVPDLFPRTYRAARALAAAPGVCWVLAAAALLISSTPLAGPWLIEALTPAEEIIRHLLYLAVGVLVVLPAAFGDPNTGYIRALSTRSARHLGHISYSMFLVHMALIPVVMWIFGFEDFGGHFAVILIGTVAASAAVSEVLYRFVEKPFVRFSRPRETQARTAPSAAMADS